MGRTRANFNKLLVFYKMLVELITFPLYTGYLKAVWPGFCGCVFEIWPAPGAWESLQKCGVASPPTFLKAFPDPRGRPDLKNSPQKTLARLPSGAQNLSFDKSPTF